PCAPPPETKRGRKPLVVQQEALRARVELDAPCAPVEAPDRFLDRRLVHVEPNERDQPAARPLPVLQRAVGRRAGSSMQNMNAREMPYVSMIRASSSYWPEKPSMSCPRWTWASKISTSAGRSRRSWSSLS